VRKFIAIVLCILLSSSSLLSQVQTTPTANAGAVRQSAVRNSFREVTSYLDPGGNLYLYLSTEEWLNGLSAQVSQFRVFVDALGGASPADKQDAGRFFDLLTNLVKHSGVEEISGVGMSGIAVEKGYFRSRSMLHHYPGKDTGYLWSVFGKQPHALGSLDLLPANTAYAAFSDLDLPLVWSILNSEIAQSGIPEGQQLMQSLRAEFAGMAGVDLDKALASLGNECGLVITLDDTKPITLPPPAGQIPDVALMLACKVKSDTIFDRVDAMLRSNPSVIRTDRADLRMRTLPPISAPLTLRPAVARSGDYLFLASNDALVEAALAVKSKARPGLKSTDEFKKLSRDVPEQGNSFVFQSTRFADLFGILQSRILAGTATTNNSAQVLSSLFGSPGAPGAYRVSANTADGWLSTGNSGQSPVASLLWLPSVALTAIVASVAIPSLLRSRQAANESAAVANLRTIATAEITYLASSRSGAADMRTLISAGLLDSRFTSTFSGYNFTINVSGPNYTATATPTTSDAGRYGYFVNPDGVVRYSNSPVLAPQGMGGFPVQ